LKAFVDRFVDFINMAREAPSRFNGIVRGGTPDMPVRVL
jgi:hypothetical protein